MNGEVALLTAISTTKINGPLTGRNRTKIKHNIIAVIYQLSAQQSTTLFTSNHNAKFIAIFTFGNKPKAENKVGSQVQLLTRQFVSLNVSSLTRSQVAIFSISQYHPPRCIIDRLWKCNEQNVNHFPKHLSRIYSSSAEKIPFLTQLHTCHMITNI